MACLSDCCINLRTFCHRARLCLHSTHRQCRQQDELRAIHNTPLAAAGGAGIDYNKRSGRRFLTKCSVHERARVTWSTTCESDTFQSAVVVKRCLRSSSDLFMYLNFLYFVTCDHPHLMSCCMSVFFSVVYLIPFYLIFYFLIKIVMLHTPVFKLPRDDSEVLRPAAWSTRCTDGVKYGDYYEIFMVCRHFHSKLPV